MTRLSPVRDTVGSEFSAQKPDRTFVCLILHTCPGSEKKMEHVQTSFRLKRFFFFYHDDLGQPLCFAREKIKGHNVTSRVWYGNRTWPCCLLIVFHNAISIRGRKEITTALWSKKKPALGVWIWTANADWGCPVCQALFPVFCIKFLISSYNGSLGTQCTER